MLVTPAGYRSHEGLRWRSPLAGNLATDARNRASGPAWADRCLVPGGLVRRRYARSTTPRALPLTAEPAPRAPSPGRRHRTTLAAIVTGEWPLVLAVGHATTNGTAPGTGSAGPQAIGS